MVVDVLSGCADAVHRRYYDCDGDEKVRTSIDVDSPRSRCERSLTSYGFGRKTDWQFRLSQVLVCLNNIAEASKQLVECEKNLKEEGPRSLSSSLLRSFFPRMIKSLRWRGRSVSARSS